MAPPNPSPNYRFLRARPDFLKQMYRWAVQDCENAGVTVYGVPMSVEVIDITEFLSIGFAITIMSYDEAGALVPAFRLEALMDEEVVQGFDRVGMGEDGFPVLQTYDDADKPVKGKNFIVRRDAAAAVPPEYVAPIKQLLTNMMGAVNKYYAFGSCFAEEF